MEPPRVGGFGEVESPYLVGVGVGGVAPHCSAKGKGYRLWREKGKLSISTSAPAAGLWAPEAVRGLAVLGGRRTGKGGVQGCV